jgi:hypothetical protein
MLDLEDGIRSVSFIQRGVEQHNGDVQAFAEKVPLGVMSVVIPSVESCMPVEQFGEHHPIYEVLKAFKTRAAKSGMHL